MTVQYNLQFEGEKLGGPFSTLCGLELLLAVMQPASPA